VRMSRWRTCGRSNSGTESGSARFASGLLSQRQCYGRGGNLSSRSALRWLNFSLFGRTDRRSSRKARPCECWRRVVNREEDAVHADDLKQKHERRISEQALVLPEVLAERLGDGAAQALILLGNRLRICSMRPSMNGTISPM